MSTLPLPPGTPITLLAHELAAALEVGDELRAAGAAVALRNSAEVIMKVLQAQFVGNRMWDLENAARVRVGLEPTT